MIIQLKRLHMDYLSTHAAFVIPILVGIISQITKFTIYTLKHGWNPGYAFTHGHMPSSHTAFIVSLVTTVGHYHGTASGSFAVTVILAVIVIDDAARLRVYMGDQGRYLNMLIRRLPIDTKGMPRLKERIGHRISEIIIGAIYGLLLSLLFINIL